MTDYSRIPPRTMESLRAWVESGVVPGSFLQCVLRNDLVAASLRADKENAAALSDIGAWLHFEAPPDCWGRGETVQAWFALKLAERTAA